MMVESEIYEAAKNGYAMVGSITRQLIDKHEAEVIYNAITNIGEASGRDSGERLKQGKEKFASQLLKSQLAGGWRSEVEIEGGKVILKNYTCPCYAGYRAGGLSYEEAREMCYRFWAHFSDGARRVNPGVKGYWLKHYRSPEEDYCLEVFEVR